MRLAGRIAAVSGAGGPMGRAVTARLVAEGVAGLALTDISAGRLAEAVAAIETERPDLPVAARRADVTRADEAAAFASAALKGLGRIDLLVNLVGGLRSARLYTPFLDMTEDQWRATFDLNLMGGFHLIRAFAPGMLERRWGRIVNVTSIVFGGEAGQADYAAAKAAVASLTRSLAAEFAPHVTVNSVAPGLTRTSVTRNMPDAERDRLVGLAMNRRMAEPEETADAVAYFLNDGARFLTGEMLSVSGGIRPHL
ncbi:SDR family NAD(P)-dependent oxidoreductase [Polymorphum gilvum]|uniref:Short-chain dehydrogenase/reductase SDR n=1 Tax=Polymorphum gilvum (strain LMG 25793 / CGMCC 1.9160 / SL003B-26A1) TaxID=991905 RepID=F2J4I0_POLGS|nr:SDR family oxidoreductase [Polymorphum gilvum]ADZ72233.1 Short-chain dehydrogenase/reductase SDR [Polymorphum gilvum SL003B-26A1]